MRIINADKFLLYLIFSKSIDNLTCGEVKEAIEMCKVDVLDEIREIIERHKNIEHDDYSNGCPVVLEEILSVIDKYMENEEND